MPCLTINKILLWLMFNYYKNCFYASDIADSCISFVLNIDVTLCVGRSKAIAGQYILYYPG